MPFAFTNSVITFASTANISRRSSRAASAAGLRFTKAATAALGSAIASFQPAATATRKDFTTASFFSAKSVLTMIALPYSFSP